MRYSTNETGATAVEYAIMVAAIAAIIVAVVFAIGLATEQGFEGTCTAMGSSPSTMTCEP